MLDRQIIIWDFCTNVSTNTEPAQPLVYKALLNALVIKQLIQLKELNQILELWPTGSRSKILCRIVPLNTLKDRCSKMHAFCCMVKKQRKYDKFCNSIQDSATQLTIETYLTAAIGNGEPRLALQIDITLAGNGPTYIHTYIICQ